METTGFDGELTNDRKYGFRGSTFYGQDYKKLAEVEVGGCSNIVMF